MKYIEVPISVAKMTEVETSQAVGIEPEWKPANATICVEHITYFFEGSSDTTTVFFTNGISTEVRLSYEDFRMLIKND